MAGRDENGAEEERSARARGDRPGSVRRPRIARAGNSDGFPYTGAARGESEAAGREGKAKEVDPTCGASGTRSEPASSPN